MKIFLVENSLSDPVKEIFEETSNQRFKKIEKFAGNGGEEPELRISANRDGSDYVIHVELHTFKYGNFIVKTKNRDIKTAVNEAAKEMKAVLSKEKDKTIGRRKGVDI